MPSPFLSSFASALALSFPLPDLHFLVWVALVPLMLALRGASPWRRWWAGFFAGFVWRIGSLYWIAHVMVNHGGMSPPVGITVAGLLAVWMALNTGLFCLLVTPALERRGIEVHHIRGDGSMDTTPQLPLF